MPHDARARRLFVTSGGLKKVQEIQADPGSTLSEYIQIINCCFPEEIIRLFLILYSHKVFGFMIMDTFNHLVVVFDCS